MCCQVLACLLCAVAKADEAGNTAGRQPCGGLQNCSPSLGSRPPIPQALCEVIHFSLLNFPHL